MGDAKVSFKTEVMRKLKVEANDTTLTAIRTKREWLE